MRHSNVCSRLAPWSFFGLFFASFLAACSGSSEPARDPGDAWAVPPAPPSDVYSGPLFEMSYDYPRNPVSPVSPLPWQEAIGGGEIDAGNAHAYVSGLKDHVAEDMRTLLFDNASWDAAEAGWYNAPWLSARREPIHGTYVGNTLPAAMFPQSGLTKEMSTHVVVYYDAVAAGSLQTIFGADPTAPVPGLEAGGGQFPESGIIVKPAFTTAGGADWPPIDGAFPWQIWAQPGGGGGQGDPLMQTIYLFQLDLIVKDSLAAPDSGWVFATLVYDASVQGDFWDQMVPLGAMWGNDPDVDSPQGCDYLVVGDCPALSESWINQDTPLYARETLGWGGRLSGPNDGAVDINAAVRTEAGIVPGGARQAVSSCMSCHGVAEYSQKSFLLPVASECSTETNSCRPSTASCTGGACVEDPDGDRLLYFETGSDDFLRWFQSRPGDEAQDEGAIPLDYGMNIAFVALPEWTKALSPQAAAAAEELNPTLENLSIPFD
ncbi:MAG: hypothetical protein VCC00_09815 [Deltaproteobacteria bacterium]